MIDFFESIYLGRRSMAQGECVDIIGDDGHGCIDALEFMPAGATNRYDWSGEPFAATASAYRGD